MLYELRIYHCAPSRMPALLKRFEDVTLKKWEQHGIRQAGFWVTEIGSDNHDLYYMLQWESLAEREEKWNAFQADPEWIKARADSEKDGPILKGISNHILKPTAFSSVQ
ncbi:MAG: NIPSNAP family protein [Rhodospirillales bacterium]|nr:NIPSNAP family protein [Rhodospirillales bacterium]MBO6788156.1 NIPSNAP family protein [Rhodospirillales bacterium]